MANKPLIDLTVRGVNPASAPLSRRSAIQWVLGAVAAAALPGCSTNGPATAESTDGPKFPDAQRASPIGGSNQEEAAKVVGKPGIAKGYGTDPDLTKLYKPGDVWPLTFTDRQKQTATALADIILPKDHLGPAASEVGVPAMVDEWVSAPYPAQQADRAIILPGLDWIEAEAKNRFQKSFAELSVDQQRAICDDIADSTNAKKDFKKGAAFFVKFRSVCAGAYYGTPQGWESIGYVGNVALGSFDGPPPEVLKQLGVEQTVA